MRCEDYPCCGHTDGDGCAPLASHSADFYYANPHLLHEPGSPEWFDAMEEREQDNGCPWCVDDDDDELDTDTLCRAHLAEYMEREQYADEYAG